MHIAYPNGDASIDLYTSIIVTIHVPPTWTKNQCFAYPIIADNALFMIIVSFYRRECE